MKLLWTGIKSIISLKNSHVNVINKLKLGSHYRLLSIDL